MTGARDRVLLVGLDMGDAVLVERWGRSGALPSLGGLLADGASGRLETTAGILHTSAWPTLFTGTLPGQHGLYYPYQPVPGRQQARRVGPELCGRPPFWALLDAAGRRCVVVDAPETFPVGGFRGVQVFEWGTWAGYWRPMTQPAGLGRTLRRRFGRYPLGLDANRLGFGRPDLERLGRRLADGAEARGRLAQWLMRSADWDLFVVVFAESHPAGHYLWPAHAPAPADGPAADGHRDLRAVRDVYAAIDAALGGLLAAAPEDVTVLVVSGDGVGPNHTAWHLLPEVLERAGFAVAAGAGRPRRGWLTLARDAVPPGLRGAVSARLPWRLRDRLVSGLAGAGLDWSRSTASCLPTDLEGWIRVNLAGREPLGVVEPGPAYEDLCDALGETLGSLADPATGQAVVRRVARIDRCFPGERRHQLPDLAVTWSAGAEVHAVQVGRLGAVTRPPADPRTGTHHPVSFLIARGPRVRRGPIPPGGHIADIAPTVLACLGVTPPRWMDGRALPGIGA